MLKNKICKCLLVLLAVMVTLGYIGVSVRGEAATKTAKTDYHKVFQKGNAMYDGKRKEADYSVKYGEALGMEFFSAPEFSVTFPAEGVIIRKILIKNTSGNSRSFDIADVTDYTGSFTKYVKQFTATTHPNGARVALAPGEECTVEVNVSPDNSLNDGKTHNVKGNLTFTVPIRVYEKEESRPEEANIVLSHKVSFVSKDLLQSKKYKTATVKGKILDASGKPVKGAKVFLKSRVSDESQEVTTKKDGTYKFKEYAYKTAYSGMWREAALFVKATGYIDRGVMVYPKKGKTVTINPTLYKKEYQYTYKRTKTVDIGIQGYEYDTDHKTIAVFAPFHTGLAYEQIADRLKLTATDFKGNTLFTYPLPSEIPYVSISENGNYTVALLNQKDNSSYKIAIVDKTGKEVYSTDITDLPKVDKYGVTGDTKRTLSRCAAISPDGNYLVASTGDGYVWYIDWKNNKVLWADYLYGQVRNIKFLNDGSMVYISSGSGYLYAYGQSGALKWKTFLGSWATKMVVTGKYVVAATKNAGDNVICLERTTGKICWSYPEQQGSAMGFSVTPDGKYLWVGFFAGTAYDVNACSVYALQTGKIIETYDQVVAMGGEFTKDGKLLVTKDRSSFYVYNAKSNELLFKRRIAKQDDYSGSHAITANGDGSRIIVTMNTDKEHPYYCKTYYYQLTKKQRM